MPWYEGMIPVGTELWVNVDNWLIYVDKVDQSVANINAMLPFQRCQPTPVATLILCRHINIEILFSIQGWLNINSVTVESTFPSISLTQYWHVNIESSTNYQYWNNIYFPMLNQHGYIWELIPHQYINIEFVYPFQGWYTIEMSTLGQYPMLPEWH